MANANGNKCSVVGCTHGTSSDTYYTRTAGKFELCPYHKPFFDGITDIKCDFLSQCSCEKPMIYQNFSCPDCDPQAIPVTQENLELLKAVATQFHNKIPTGKGKEKFKASDLMAWLGLSIKAGTDAADLLSILKSNPESLFNKMKGSKGKAKRKADLSQTKEELKRSAVRVAINKFVDGFIAALPTMGYKIGASVETAAAMQEFFKTTPGRSVVLAMFAGSVSYMPLGKSEKLEDIMAVVAEELRMKTYETVGTGVVDAAMSMLPNFFQDFSQAVNQIQAHQNATVEEVVEVPQQVEVPEVVNAG